MPRSTWVSRRLYTQEVDDRALNPDFEREKPFAWESTGGADDV